MRQLTWTDTESGGESISNDYCASVRRRSPSEAAVYLRRSGGEALISTTWRIVGDWNVFLAHTKVELEKMIGADRLRRPV
jgi:hypothetical protein